MHCLLCGRSLHWQCLVRAWSLDLDSIMRRIHGSDGSAVFCRAQRQHTQRRRRRRRLRRRRRCVPDRHFSHLHTSVPQVRITDIYLFVSVSQGGVEASHRGIRRLPRLLPTRQLRLTEQI